MCVWPKKHCLTVIFFLVFKLAGYTRLAFPQGCGGKIPNVLVPWDLTTVLYPCPSVFLDSYLFPVFRDARVHRGYPKASPLPSWHPRVQDACELPTHSENPVKEMRLGHRKLIPALPSHGWPCFQPHPLSPLTFEDGLGIFGYTLLTCS